MAIGDNRTRNQSLHSRLSRRQRADLTVAQLENEKQSFMSQWRDLSDYILPTRARFSLSRTNKGDRRNQKIIDSTATFSTRTLSSGLMAGITSPARPWFKLGIPDKKTAEFGPVRAWLDEVTGLMSSIFTRSNLYQILPDVYTDMGVFGSACMIVLEDTKNVINTKSFPVGMYGLGVDEFGRVNTFYRDFRMTVAQMVERYSTGLKSDGSPESWDNFSSQVRHLWENGNRQAWIDVRHVIEPNDMFNPNKVEAKYKKFASLTYELGASGVNRTSQSSLNVGGDDKDIFLKESGFEMFPILAPRWDLAGEDIYGTNCPGMVAIGDIRQLQHGEKRKAQAIDKMVYPAMIAPTSLRHEKATILPGDVTYHDIRDGMQGFRPAHEVNPRILELENLLIETRKRIQRAFYEDLFLMLSSSDRRQITATEIDERKEEKLLALGPVLERVNQDLLDPLIDLTYLYMERQNLIPEPPPELEGVDLKVEYVSIMAQAQKLASLGGIERFTGFVGQLAQFDPTVIDKVNLDQTIDVYGDVVSAPSGIVRSDEEVEQIRAARQQAQKAEQQAAQMQAMAGSAKQLSETKLDTGSALDSLLDRSNVGA